MTKANEKRYDDVPYESHPFEVSHPRWLSTVAAMFGLKMPSPESARILELGCASGGNLIPMAETLPQSTCLGIDLSSKQIAAGKAFVKATGLSNVELRQESITKVDATYGQFDYIICHGVFSWVDREVQQKIFEVCQRRLAPNGVAYISYNTYPGWHMKGMLRDMMRFHAARFKDPKAQITQSRALLNVLAKTVPSQDNSFGMLLRQESENLRKHSDYYIYHEHLELENNPLYFHEFAQRAYDSGMQFLGEAALRGMLTDQLSRRSHPSAAGTATFDQSPAHTNPRVRVRRVRAGLAGWHTRPRKAGKAAGKLAFQRHGLLGIATGRMPDENGKGGILASLDRFRLTNVVITDR